MLLVALSHANLPVTGVWFHITSLAYFNIWSHLFSFSWSAWSSTTRPRLLFSSSFSVQGWMCQTHQKTEPPNSIIQSSILSASQMCPAPELPQGLLRDDILSSSYVLASSLTGICYSSSECSGLSGGYADGRCAQGFGVCCVIRSGVKSSIFETWNCLCSQVHRLQRQDISELYPHPEPGLPRRLHRHHLVRVHPHQGQHRHLPVQAGLC